MLQYKIIFQLLTSFPNCSENTSYNSTINLIGTSTFIPPVYQLSTAVVHMILNLHHMTASHRVTLSLMIKSGWTIQTNMPGPDLFCYQRL